MSGVASVGKGLQTVLKSFVVFWGLSSCTPDNDAPLPVLRLGEWRSHQRMFLEAGFVYQQQESLSLGGLPGHGYRPAHLSPRYEVTLFSDVAKNVWKYIFLISRQDINLVLVSIRKERVNVYIYLRSSLLPVSPEGPITYTAQDKGVFIYLLSGNYTNVIIP